MNETAYTRALADLKEIEFELDYPHDSAGPEKRVLSPHSGDEFLEIHYDTPVRALSILVAVENKMFEDLEEIMNGKK